mgnify:CR=1 FL=1
MGCFSFGYCDRNSMLLVLISLHPIQPSNPILKLGSHKSGNCDVIIIGNLFSSHAVKMLELELEFLSSIKRPILTYGTRVYMCS